MTADKVAAAFAACEVSLDNYVREANSTHDLLAGFSVDSPVDRQKVVVQRRRENDAQCST